MTWTHSENAITHRCSSDCVFRFAFTRYLNSFPRKTFWFFQLNFHVDCLPLAGKRFDNKRQHEEIENRQFLIKESIESLNKTILFFSLRPIDTSALISERQNKTEKICLDALTRVTCYENVIVQSMVKKMIRRWSGTKNELKEEKKECLKMKIEKVFWSALLLSLPPTSQFSATSQN